MSDDLLAKEKEFHRLNRDLQLRTRDAMRTVESIIHSGENLFSDANRSNSEGAKTARSEDAASRVDKQLRLSSIRVPEASVDCTGDAEIPRKDSNVGDKAVITLLKGKIDMLYKKLQVVQLEYNNKCDYCEELEVERKKLDDVQVKLRSQIGTLNDTVTKLERVNSDTLLDYQALNNENIVLKKDLESLKKETRTLSQQSTNLDVRLNRALESNEKLRSALKCSQTDEKELRNQVRKLQDDKKLAVKNLKKQRAELVQAFKRQTLLVDNLKKQNMHLMANGQISLTKEDFAKLLEWKPQKVTDTS
ncbi:PREDICTED: testis-expressed sequence 9 protein [Vollenhovia emeryi]|uniref:testis-expressed sequence 9 protein n=1 Tax=Vollenhovia emeryi TaxID=411798 RepID=UPI0005F42CB4|nr:PREDICTED: testis-expressed sequence 9 protein [Vollenhovia emeryi]XP_011874295.1 PREDICTED: testis-expressed sequence 9 protein [Vollenhovia emeryi]XP_011874296.1 PREDICTED: testis-expressed sequence 9 protein [Vollenhovia emeryi]XP_011874297.1 PREDICTED: testis-expressed sequence 9 protein [Vollenhovia emeryi]